MKYSNYLIFILLLISGVFLKSHIEISTNLLSLFASKESLQRLDIANKLGYSKEMLIAVKGFSKNSRAEVKEIVKKLNKLKEINSITYSLTPTKEIQNYYRENYTLLADFNSSKLTRADVKERLEKLYNQQLNALFYTPVNKSDPLSLFKLPLSNKGAKEYRNNLLTLGNYGYLIRVESNVSASDVNSAKQLYKKVHQIFKAYPNVVAFAPFFYTVENSAAIQSDVQYIVILSTILLLLLYYMLIKNIKLLTQTVIALASSMLFATLICTTLFSNFNILSLAFGMSLTAVSIDYLLHYYFHNFYQTKEKIDKDVLYGFLTTVSAFGIFIFIPIPLISQISLFSVLSLSFAYLLFTFIFPYLNIAAYVGKSSDTKRQRFSLSSKAIFAISILLFIYTAFHFKLDSNLRNLDYQNKGLQTAQKLFQNANKKKLTPVIVEGKNDKELIDNLTLLEKKAPATISLASFVLSSQTCHKKLKTLQEYNFQKVNKFINEEANKIGFKKNYFQDAYTFAQKPQNCKIPSLAIFQSLSLPYYATKEKVYTIALVPNTQTIESLKFVKQINVKEMFKKSTNMMYENLLLFGSIVLVVIFFLVYISVKERFLFALNYILFPTAVTMALISSFEAINLMHLFSLIILIAIGIDYGIYMSNSKTHQDTMIAIKYSLLSTFGAFGVLVFSTITALNSIGLVITVGCGAIFILIKVMR